MWRLYRRRGIAAPADIERELGALLPPDRLRGLDSAVAILFAAVEQRKHVLVVGDFDADGATSCGTAKVRTRHGPSSVSTYVTAELVVPRSIPTT